MSLVYMMFMKAKNTCEYNYTLIRTSEVTGMHGCYLVTYIIVLGEGNREFQTSPLL